MEFTWPLLLPLLLIAPLCVYAYRRSQERRRRQLARLGAFGGLVSAEAKPRYHKLPPILFLISLILLLFALSRPEMNVTLPRIEGTVVLAFDVSNSMLADDLEPTRIDAAKAAARAFVENQPSTVKVGVVAFSNGGLIVQQPSNIKDDVIATIDRLSPQGGTSLGQGILSSLNAIAGETLVIDAEALAGARQEGAPPLGVEPYFGSVIVLLSDGENTGLPEPLDVAQVSAEANVRIYPIGIGSREGSVIEVDGFSVVTQLNEEPLQAIADLTNGTYYYAEDADTLQEIYESIDLQLTVRGEKMEITALLAVISVLLLLVAVGLSLFWFGRVA